VTGHDAVAAIFATATSASALKGRYVAQHKLDDRTAFLRWNGSIDGQGNLVAWASATRMARPW